MGLLPITPTRSFLPCIITRWAVNVLGSKPPKVWNLRKPPSSMCVTINPISSIWAATMILFPSGFLLPFLTAMTLPRLSVLTSSASGVTNSTTKSLTLFSKPGAPAISQICFSKGTFISIVFKYSIQVQSEDFGTNASHQKC